MTIYRWEPMRPKANIGDLVRVLGYGLRVFRVDSITYEHYRDGEEEYDGIIYDVTCVETLAWEIAFDEDVSIVSRSKNSQTFLQSGKYSLEPKPDYATIDEMLLDLSDAMALQERFGDHEDDKKQDRKYANKVDEIKVKLRKMTEGGV